MSSADERFLGQPDLDMDFEGSTECLAATFAAGRFITITEADLNVAQARILRDWLNKALP